MPARHAIGIDGDEVGIEAVRARTDSTVVVGQGEVGGQEDWGLGSQRCRPYICRA
jgi:hypothetical protein